MFTHLLVSKMKWATADSPNALASAIVVEHGEVAVQCANDDELV